MGQDIDGDRRLGPRHARGRGARRRGAGRTIPPSASASRSAPRRSQARDKLTLIVPPALRTFGLWVEQLVAESTGKHGVGVVPIAGEPLADSDVVRRRSLLRPGARDDVADAGRRRRLSTTARETVRRCRSCEIDVAEPAALGAEFVRWEIATAVAGAMLAHQSVRRAERAAGEGRDAGAARPVQRARRACRSPRPTSPLRDGVALTLTRDARTVALGSVGPTRILTLIQPGDYFALLAYLRPDAELAEALQRASARAVRDRTRAATMFGYGPRYLHSTGQLHKGGPNTGVFVLVDRGADRGPADPRRDVFVRHAGARAGARRFRVARRDRPPRRCTCICPRRRRGAHRGAGREAARSLERAGSA